MGEAKRRGTFEQRKAAAKGRKTKNEVRRQMIKERRRGKSLIEAIAATFPNR